MSHKSPDKKVLQRTARKVGVGGSRSKREVGLKEQYSIIRQDLVRLRDDIVKGYDLTKDWIDKRSAVKDFLLRAK